MLCGRLALLPSAAALTPSAAAVRMPTCCMTAESQTKADKLAAAIFRGGYLQEDRVTFLGEMDSCSLLEADNANGLLPPGLERDANAQQLTFVDEYSCIGCRNCAEVARATFRMEEDFGVARVYQQCGDDPDVIDEAVDCCPVDCIHAVSFNELRVLEDARARMLASGEAAAAQGVGKLSARAEGRDGAPGEAWRAPLRGMSFDDGALDAPRGVPLAPASAAPRDGVEAQYGVEAAFGSELEGEPALDPTGEELGMETLASLFPDPELDMDME